MASVEQLRQALAGAKYMIEETLTALNDADNSMEEHYGAFGRHLAAAMTCEDNANDATVTALDLSSHELAAAAQVELSAAHAQLLETVALAAAQQRVMGDRLDEIEGHMKAAAELIESYEKFL